MNPNRGQLEPWSVIRELVREEGEQRKGRTVCAIPCTPLTASSNASG